MARVKRALLGPGPCPTVGRPVSGGLTGLNCSKTLVGATFVAPRNRQPGPEVSPNPGEGVGVGGRRVTPRGAGSQGQGAPESSDKASGLQAGGWEAIPGRTHQDSVRRGQRWARPAGRGAVPAGKQRQEGVTEGSPGARPPRTSGTDLRDGYAAWGGQARRSKGPQGDWHRHAVRRPSAERVTQQKPNC